MTDLSNLVQAISNSAPDPNVRLRQGVIQSVNADGSATVKIGGSTTNVTNVKVASSACPIPGATCWLVTDGRDWYIQATLAPSGPAYGTMRKSTAQTITTSTFTELTWGSTTDTQNVGMTLGSNGLNIVVPGLYSVTGSVVLVGNATGQRVARLLKNSTAEYQGTSISAPGTIICRMTVTGIVKCTINDVLNLEVWQSSGANLNTDVAGGANRISATWLGPVA